ncbi:Isochorismatase family protein [Maioricimonas rarisocia]|uniref:Isochorismatase family protein n=1 Tax=Maioricimonas rarisocia TaxID=2528026 RepID=A0A517Z9F6_9PLAN|nr:hydrolase [Maioricimonas rarisocia]QDU39103.1 Isochorismatase family protein [Maioricimonas rarisocia]
MNEKTPDPLRSRELLSRDDSRLLVVDMQEKLLNVIPVARQIVWRTRQLIRAARLLNVPVDATEQYPQGLGPTVGQLSELLDPPPPKMRFSCADCLDWASPDQSGGDRYKVVIAGIETHVCVLQTALDLTARGWEVCVVADAVASRNQLDWTFALQRLSASGVTVTTTEAVLFEWCESADDDAFREVRKLVVETPPAD